MGSDQIGSDRIGYQPAYLPAYLGTYLPACLPRYLPIYLPAYLPSSLPLPVGKFFICCMIACGLVVFNSPFCLDKLRTSTSIF